MPAEEALRQAEAEGLTLVRSQVNNTGYMGVHFKSDRRMPYLAQVQRGGKQVALGTFATAEEAALVVARTPEAQAAVAAAAAPPAPPPLTAEEAVEQAEAEGLTLLKYASSSTGYKGVSSNSSKRGSKPYMTTVWRGGKNVTIGYFTTAEEAALCYARTPEAQAAGGGGGGGGGGGRRGGVSSLSRKRKASTEEEPPDTRVITLEGEFEGERRLSERFEELEECRKRGFVTDEEYTQKRAELTAASKTAPAAAKATKKLKPETEALAPALAPAPAPAPVPAPAPAPAPIVLPAPAAVLLPVPLCELSVAQVGELLHRLGLGKYAEAFAEFPVDGACLVVADSADLEEAGMGAAMHRKKFLAALTELMAA